MKVFSKLGKESICYDYYKTQCIYCFGDVVNIRYNTYLRKWNETYILYEINLSCKPIKYE